MPNKNPTVINVKNNIIGWSSWIGNDQYLVKEMDGAYFVFHDENLQDVEEVTMRPIKITSDRNHSVLYVNQRPVFQNLEEVVKERLDRIQAFLLKHS